MLVSDFPYFFCARQWINHRCQNILWKEKNLHSQRKNMVPSPGIKTSEFQKSRMQSNNIIGKKRWIYFLEKRQNKNIYFFSLSLSFSVTFLFSLFCCILFWPAVVLYRGESRIHFYVISAFFSFPEYLWVNVFPHESRAKISL